MKKLLVVLPFLSLLSLTSCGAQPTVPTFEGEALTQEHLQGKSKSFVHSILNSDGIKIKNTLNKFNFDLNIGVSEQEVKINGNAGGAAEMGVILGTTLADSKAYVTTDGLFINVDYDISGNENKIEIPATSTSCYLVNGSFYFNSTNAIFVQTLNMFVPLFLSTVTSQEMSQLMLIIKSLIPEYAYITIPDANQIFIDLSSLSQITDQDFIEMDKMLFSYLSSFGEGIKYKDYGDGAWGLNLNLDALLLKTFMTKLGVQDFDFNIIKDFSYKAGFKFDSSSRLTYLGMQEFVQIDGVIDGANVKIKAENEEKFEINYNLGDFSVPEIDKYIPISIPTNI